MKEKESTLDRRMRHGASSGPLHGFRTAFAAEAMKGARTATRKTALIAPLPLCLLGLMSSGLVTGGYGAGGAGFNTYGWCWWYTLLLPVAISLVTAGVANIDARQKFHGIMSAPVWLQGVWHAKTAYAFLLVIVANLVVALVSSIIWLLGGNAAGPVASICMTALLSASSLWMIPAGLFLTARFGTLCGIAMPLLAQLAGGIACYASDLWWLLPPAAAMRLCSPLAGVAPSGVPLVPGEAFGIVDGAWVAALVIAVVFGAVLVFAGAAWFARQEVR